jgi:GNAT superfamily N-acetyltransferase
MEWGLNVRGAKGNGHYVYPVIVFANWRKLGVASALVRYELKRHGQLKLVACRPSRGFYERSGFAHETWENIAYQIARDCEQCPNLKSCDPQPFVISR